MVLRPVELDATTDPRTCQSDEGWFDDVVIVDEVALFDLVVCHLHATAQFGQNHHLDILVFQPYGLIVLIDFLVGYRLDDRVGIDHSRRALIDTFLQEHRILLGFSDLVCWYGHQRFPSFNGRPTPCPPCEGGSSYFIIIHTCFIFNCVILRIKLSAPLHYREGPGVGPTNSFSSCSRLFPLVSGQLRNRKIKAQAQMAL